MTNTSIARPYAKAAFEFAKRDHQLPRWLVALRALSMAVQDVSMTVLLKNPFVSSDKTVEILLYVLRQVTDNGSFALDQGIENFIRLLAAYKRLNILPEIAILFEADVAKNEGYLQLTVMSAYPLTKEQQVKLAGRLKAQLHSEVKINYEENPDIIAGIVVRSGHWVLDDSVRGRLARLQSTLN